MLTLMPPFQDSLLQVVDLVVEYEDGSTASHMTTGLEIGDRLVCVGKYPWSEDTTPHRRTSANGRAFRLLTQYEDRFALSGWADA